jgi:sporulation protein YlmC with PRC-barrel domain
MTRFALLGLVSFVSAAAPVLAQPAPGPAAPAATVPAATASSVPSGVPTNPDLAVATVKLQAGSRISRLIGSVVYNDQNEKVGSIDDLITIDGNRIVMAVISVGGFLGMGNKLVAVPYEQLHIEMNKDDVKVAMPGANKDALSAMPTFTYSG